MIAQVRAPTETQQPPPRGLQGRWVCENRGVRAFQPRTAHAGKCNKSMAIRGCKTSSCLSPAAEPGMLNQG
eukprot:6457792-Amphidinium_carterae.1